MPAPQPDRASASRARLGIAALALLPRVAVVALALRGDPAKGFFRYGLEMGWLARSLLGGQGLSSPFGLPTGPTAFIAPGYPLLVALVFHLFGSYTAAAAAVLMSLNIVANLVTLLLLMRIASRLFNEQAARIAGLLWACSPVLWFMPTIFWETSLSACFLTALVAFALDSRTLPSNRWLFAGALSAVAALVNPALLPAILASLSCAALLASGSRSQRAGRLCLALVALATVFAPWPIRNAAVFHAWIPLRSTVGFELWMGNRPGADGYLDESLFPAYNAHELEQYRQKGEVSYTADKQALAVQSIEQHPARFAALTAVRTLRFWSGAGNRQGSALFVLQAMFTSILGGLGLARLWRRTPRSVAILLTLPLLLFPLPYCLTHAEFRYRLVLEPLLIALAGGAIACAFGRPKPASIEKGVDRLAVI